MKEAKDSVRRKLLTAQKEAISTSKAPKAIGPYSQGIKAGSFIFTSGQIPIKAEDRQDACPTGDDIKMQIRQVMNNLKAILEAGGSSLSNVVKTTVYLKNLKNFDAVNEVYKEYFTEPFPARSAVEVSNLPKNVEIEIEAIAVL